MALPNVLNGEATSWLISAKPTEQNWPLLKTEILAMFIKPMHRIFRSPEHVVKGEDGLDCFMVRQRMYVILFPPS